MSSNAFSRRESIRALGAGALAGFFGGASVGGGARLARAEAPATSPTPAGATEDLQGAGFYRFEVGDARMILASDGNFTLSPALLGANASEGAVAKAMEEASLDPANITAHINVLLIDVGGRKILVDTGCGNAFGPTTGFAMRNLARAGVKPHDITDVILTHLHPDHVGGLLGDAGADAFPNATFHLHRDEQAFWTSANPDLGKTGVPDDFRKQLIGVAQKVADLVKPRLKLVESGAKVADGIDVIHLPGHTPGHVGLRYQKGKDQFHFITDAAHFPLLQFDHPEWHVGFDADPERAIESRKTAFAQAAAQRALIAGSHLIFPALGRIRMHDATRFEWRGETWKW